MRQRDRNTMICATLGALLLWYPQTAHADSDYQPYYYNRDTLQFTTPKNPIWAQQPPAATVTVTNTSTVVPATPLDNSREGMQFSQQPVALPVQTAPAPITVASLPIRADDQRTTLQYEDQPVASTRLGMPAYKQMEEPIPESMDLGTGFGW